MSIPNKEVRSVIREAREALGLSQASLAALAGVTASAVSIVESAAAAKLLTAMRPELVARATASQYDADPAALRALARLQEAVDVDRKR